MTRKALGKGLEVIFANLGTEVINTRSGALLHEIELSQITPNPFQPRHIFSEKELNELSESIAQKGLLQPILLRKHNNGYQIVAGERRFRAFQQLGKSHIPSVVRDQISDRDMMEIALIENIQRVQLNPIEEAKAYDVLVNTLGMTHEDISGRVGKSRASITNTLRLLKLEDPVLQWVSEGKLSAGHGRALLQLQGPEQVKRARVILESELNVRQAEKRIEPKAPRILDPNARAIEEELCSLIGLKVSLIQGGNKGAIEIHYATGNDVETVLKILRLGCARQ